MASGDGQGVRYLGLFAAVAEPLAHRLESLSKAVRFRGDPGTRAWRAIYYKTHKGCLTLDIAFVSRFLTG